MKEELSRRSFLAYGAAAGVAGVTGLELAQDLSAAKSAACPWEVRGIENVTVFQEAGKFAGWPANRGIWSWGNEILTGFVLGDHQDGPGHTVDRSTVRLKFARSLDGGMTWNIEDAYEHGIDAASHNQRIGELAEPPVDCPGGIDFTHPDFALVFDRMNNHTGPSHFYYSYDRGRSWEGAFNFPNLDTLGIANRTDYVVEGQHQLLVMFTAAKHDEREGRVGCARTHDGGKTWERVAWVGPAPEEGYAIMPSTVRVGPEKLVTVIRNRRTQPTTRAWLDCYASEDNGRTWQHLGEPVSDQGGGNPPALVRLRDGRLCLAYGVRIPPSYIAVRFSGDDGQTWTDEIVVRGNDGASGDMGYPRMVQRPDGKVLVVYYYNNSMLPDGDPYRYIGGTLFDPGNRFDVSGDGNVNAVDVQLVINAVLGIV